MSKNEDIKADTASEAADGKEESPGKPGAPKTASGQLSSGAVSGGAGPALDSPANLYGQLLRLKAEFENFRKRVDREKPEWVRMGEVGLLQRLLPLYDVLLHAHTQVLKSSAADSVSSKELVKGLDMIFKEFTKIFESEGVKVIETVGKPYHHDLHEVLGAVETDDAADGTVVEELQRGYTFQGKVLRPARVRIAKPKSKS